MLSLLPMIRTVKILISLLFLFLVHRLLSWPFLAERYGSRSGSLWQELLTGILSDFWIAMVLTLPFLVFEFFPEKKSTRSLQKVLAIIWIFMWGAFTAAHQTYVEFFKFQIIPFHLSYLVDKSFVAANSDSLFQASSLIVLATGASLAFWSMKAVAYRRRRRVAALATMLLVAAVMAHVLNIRWRVNWFVIEPLQTNYLEALYSNLRKKPSIRPISDSEKDLFVKITGQASFLVPEPGHSSSELAEVRAEVDKRVKQSKTVMVALLIAESLRDADTGPRPTDNLSLTPTLDALKQKGVHFANFFSSGPVTRGGQESSWCGTPSATDTSIMRSFPDVNIKCIPTLTRERKDTRSLWLHGGDQRFDSQLAFWTHQGVNRFLTESDFPEETPKTGWGVSDLALFDESAKVLTEASRSKDVKLILPMILSVSNHIPWAVPSDASLTTKNLVVAHPSHRTIKYFDESLDLFIGELKQRGLWENSILIIVGDHGNTETLWRPSYTDDPMKWERMLSHVSMTMTGGVIESLRAEGRLPAVVSQFTGQSQIAPFIAHVAGLSTNYKFMDRPLFEESPWPVFSDLNQYLFLPKTGTKVPKENVLEGIIPSSNSPEWLASTRYRAWLEFLYSSKKDAN